MDNLRFSVVIDSFHGSVSDSDVLQFVHPHDPLEIRIRSREHSSEEIRYAYVDFTEKTAAEALIAEKHNSRFKGRSMQVRFVRAKQRNDENSRNYQVNRLSGDGESDRFRLREFGKPVVARNFKTTEPEILRGAFTIITSVSCTHFVAVESCWRKDLNKLTEGLREYAKYVQCGVDDMQARVAYACFHSASREWRRCRKIGDEGNSVLVEFIDHGSFTSVTKGEILVLSSLYKDWIVKSSDLKLENYAADITPTQTLEIVDDVVLNRTFDVTYILKPTGLLTRDRVQVLDMELDDKSVLDHFVRVGVLRKLSPTLRDRAHVAEEMPRRPI